MSVRFQTLATAVAAVNRSSCTSWTAGAVVIGSLLSFSRSLFSTPGLPVLTRTRAIFDAASAAAKTGTCRRPTAHMGVSTTTAATAASPLSSFDGTPFRTPLFTCGAGRRYNHSLVGQQAPNFEAKAVLHDGSFAKVSLGDFKGKFVLLFFYPLDFTFVCPSEILAFDKALDEFRMRGVEVIGCSTDSHFSHYAWRETVPSRGGIGAVRFPLLADFKKQIAKDYGVLHPEGMALRGLFILNRDHKVCHALINDLAIGRSVDEALRVVDAIQFVEAHGEVCPANWKKGEMAIKPDAAGIAYYLKETFSS